MDSKYSILDLAFRENDGRLAIWYKTFGGTDFLVNPCTLFDSILGDKDETYFLVRDKENLWFGDKYIRVQQTFDGKTFKWVISSPYLQGNTVLLFHYDEYWTKVKNAIIQLYDAMAAGRETYYDGKITLEHVSRIYSQLKLTELFLMPGMKRTADIDVENFEFVCPRKGDDVKPWSIDVPYSIVIGKRKYDKWISDWSNDLDNIRHSIENYVFKGKCRVVLCLDDEETIVDLSRYPTLESTERVGAGTAYHYKDFMKVEVQPGYYYDGAPQIGICEQKQVIRRLYEGLLNIARIGYRYTKDKYDNDWRCSPMTFYNRIKSPIIEDYLNERKYDEDELQIRQRIIKHVLTICPDYGDVLFCDEEGVCYGVDCLENAKKLKLDKSLLSEFYFWQSDFESKTDGINSTMGTLDNEEWNGRGLKLAHRLRQQLPDDIDLWYVHPFEDKENRDISPILIYKDYNAVIVQKEKQKEIAFNKMAMLSKAIKEASNKDEQQNCHK